jgi:DNA (cytosine-5)-methyltransferase 1
MSSADDSRAISLRTIGLFAGIGGIERGLSDSGHHTELLCEVMPEAQKVLRTHFRGVPLHGDVKTLRELPQADLLAAGFPCQDLSQAGRTAGIGGDQSGLVSHVFRLLDQHQPTWLLLENVPFMLQLDRGQAMSYLTQLLGERGYRWAYRVVDTRAFGLPQRRQRVLLLASKDADPRPVLFGEDAEPAEAILLPDSACGFYWTEGLRGLGWAVDAIPTLKGGSTIGIPSPPGIWRRGTEEGPTVVTPDIRDAERLQGFDVDWTASAVDDPERRNGPRWKLVGNAVSVPVARWMGQRLAHDRDGEAHGADATTAVAEGRSWPSAAWGEGQKAWRVDVSTWPRTEPYARLTTFLQYPGRPLTLRATAGFHERTKQSGLRFPAGFISAIESHREYMAEQLAA